MSDPSSKYAVIGLLVVTALAGLPTLAAAAKIDKTAITAIEFRLVDENLEQFGFRNSRQQIADRVSKNLAEWQYQLKQGLSNYSHRLEAKVGKMDHKETPVGFSFSSGNSDPRAADFQKADVLPISCRLSKIGDVDANVEMQMTFSQAKTMDKLIDQISTVCFNLLEDLKLPTAVKKIDSTTFKPAWIPAVQVEVQQIPTLEKLEPIELKDRDTNDDSRKQIIIHNQGSPLIINFGHERR